MNGRIKVSVTRPGSSRTWMIYIKTPMLMNNIRTLRAYGFTVRVRA